LLQYLHNFNSKINILFKKSGTTITEAHSSPFWGGVLLSSDEIDILYPIKKRRSTAGNDHSSASCNLNRIFGKRRRISIFTCAYRENGKEEEEEEKN